MPDSLTRHRAVPTVALALFAALLSILVLWTPVSGAATVPTGFEDSEFAGGLRGPTAMEFAPDGRLFVAEIGGTIRVVDNGTLREEPFVTIPDVDAEGGRGVQGLTFDPQFSTNHFVYVHYTQAGTAGERSHNRIVRFTADAANGEPNTAEEVDGIGKPIFEMGDLGLSTKHNGGHIHFGNDGKLYIPVGDNKRDRYGPILNTMKLTNLFGKVLRINADGSIPPDNPFLESTTGKNGAIYARGFRNPFSFAVEPAPSNVIYINDVGEQRWEEINNLKAGANYGWPRYEGPNGGARFEKPIFAYKHDKLPNTPPATSGCAITGGTFYYPPAGASTPFPDAYQGDYLFADFCNGWIRNLDADTGRVSGFARGARSPVDLKVGPDGSLYYLEVGGSVRVIRANTGG
jgi:glucose/arabinose dehydrogenase